MTPHKTKPVLTWVGKDVRSCVEPRILLDDPALSHRAARAPADDDHFDNRVVGGDNLLALEALRREFEGQVRTVYIDPPYNTGYAFEHYDDGVEHGLWLTLMRDRLELLRHLLRDDGVIVVQIGFDEMAYLKVLMDEVFGRAHCIGQVAVRMSHSAGMKRQAKDRRLIKNTEYLLFYFKQDPPTLYPLYDRVDEFPVNYHQWITELPSDGAPGRYIGLAEELGRRFGPLFEKHGFKPTNRSVAVLFQREEAVRRFLVDHRERVARKDSNAPTGLPVREGLAADQFVQVTTEDRSYFLGRGEGGSVWQLYSLAEKVQEVSYADEDGEARKEPVIANLLGDWWDGFWRDMSRVDREGGVLMKGSKKPERLVQWVLELTTRPGDLVLDAFLGSGTTAAVAHKMRRRWIGIELGAHGEELAVPRLRRVVDGEDESGITAALGWKGGGGFRFQRLGPCPTSRGTS